MYKINDYTLISFHHQQFLKLKILFLQIICRNCNLFFKLLHLLNFYNTSY